MPVVGMKLNWNSLLHEHRTSYWLNRTVCISMWVWEQGGVNISHTFSWLFMLLISCQHNSNTQYTFISLYYNTHQHYTQYTSQCHLVVCYFVLVWDTQWKLILLRFVCTVYKVCVCIPVCVFCGFYDNYLFSLSVYCLSHCILIIFL